MEFMFNEKETKLLIIIFNQAFFQVDSSKPIKLRRKMCVIKQEPIRLILIKQFFQTGTIRHVGLELGNQFGASHSIFSSTIFDNIGIRNFQFFFSFYLYNESIFTVLRQKSYCNNIIRVSVIRFLPRTGRGQGIPSKKEKKLQLHENPVFNQDLTWTAIILSCRLESVHQNI
ncbi:hypothetical protein AGLY_011631 [Aphis glycines]|uniref:Uncharacterized protein n=1 Tax=Aphis glycines TaxID=307491 RepID=A0A6G0TB48_APHGL|nr:hypothetical protein AGLY_011631 [Aphis glycines]